MCVVAFQSERDSLFSWRSSVRCPIIIAMRFSFLTDFGKPKRDVERRGNILPVAEDLGLLSANQ